MTKQDANKALSGPGPTHGRPVRRDVLRLAIALGALAAPGTLGATSAKAADRSHVPGHLAGQDVTKLPLTERKVALTFDCGSTPDGVDKVLTALGEHALPATFFMTGRFASTHSDAARRIGHQHPGGNHSMTHPMFTKLTRDQRAREVWSAAGAINKAVGRPPVPFFRFPFGDVNRECIADVNAEGYVCVRWTVDTCGWKGTSGGATTDTVIDRVMEALTPGAIVLMHVGSTSATDPSTVDATALPHLIKAINDQGYGYTTLDALFS
ncbi:polysaccharide deacetylase family protein [Streptantibioticus rubrisoli]|uniref:Polysaccharide deacetylase family protein n=1 Tax=Streptantibioticus rubrisoli TaxID=1387313 RepID=A0ABT1PNF4_9ACTN|nr:polysaccharide deacetylase family protein [Streptantibioticus rubrisoli]MCQ4045778.1 polysaccharide deacetylase family protein [Streptantibioticus rubrisoli]